MMPKTFLCSGEQHSLVCSTNQDHLQWRIQIVLPSRNIYYSTRILSVSSSVGNHFLRRIGDATINITKNSVPGALPLTSTLLMDPVTTSINGSIITCNEIHVSDYIYFTEAISITIQVINGKVEHTMQATKSLI